MHNQLHGPEDTSERGKIVQNIIAGEYNFERVDNFKYLGATITAEMKSRKKLRSESRVAIDVGTRWGKY